MEPSTPTQPKRVAIDDEQAIADLLALEAELLHGSAAERPGERSAERRSLGFMEEERRRQESIAGR
jgi:hypothetical protein